MRIFVTGGSGFIGGALVRGLARAGHEVRVLVRSERALCTVSAEGAVPVRGDITLPGNWQAEAAAGDAVVHAAGCVGDWGRRREFFRVNVEGTQNLLAALKGWGGHLIHLSSIAVHGFRAGAYTEESPVRPNRHPYCASKAAAESLVANAVEDGLSASIARIAGVYGPGDPHFLARFSDLARSGRVYFIGRGDQPSNLIFIDDVVDALERMIDRGAEAAGIFILSAPDAPCVRDALRQAISVLDLRARVLRAPVAIAYLLAFVQEALGRLTGKHPSITRYAVRAMNRACFFSVAAAERRLGWRPRTPFPEGLARTMAGRSQKA